MPAASHRRWGQAGQATGGQQARSTASVAQPQRRPFARGHIYSAACPCAALGPTDLLRPHHDVPALDLFEFNPAFNSFSAIVGIWNAAAGQWGFNALPVKTYSQFLSEDLS